MSQHRMLFTPDPVAGQRFTGRHFLVALFCAIGVGWTIVAVTRDGGETTVAPPDVFAKEVVSPQRLAEIRAEAFRAGYANAVHDGCSRPALLQPIGTR